MNLSSEKYLPFGKMYNLLSFYIFCLLVSISLYTGVTSLYIIFGFYIKGWFGDGGYLFLGFIITSIWLQISFYVFLISISRYISFTGKKIVISDIFYGKREWDISEIDKIQCNLSPWFGKIFGIGRIFIRFNTNEYKSILAQDPLSLGENLNKAIKSNL